MRSAQREETEGVQEPGGMGLRVSIWPPTVLYVDGRCLLRALDGSAGVDMTARLILSGHVPAKKNAWRRRANGGIGVDRETHAHIDALILQARVQWGRKAPLVNPDMDVKFIVRDRRGDRDNKLTTVIDVLVKAGVLKNDNMKQFNGTLVLMPAEVHPQEQVFITITGGAA